MALYPLHITICTGQVLAGGRFCQLDITEPCGWCLPVDTGTVRCHQEVLLPDQGGGVLFIALDEVVYLTSYKPSSSGYYTIASCVLSVSVSVPYNDIDEKQATCHWNINWGRGGAGMYTQATVWYEHSTSPITGGGVTMATGTTGQHTMTGLVMDTQYKCKVRARHLISGQMLSDDTEIQFTTNDWKPDEKYDFIIDINNDAQDSAYDEHLAEYNRMVDCMDDLSGLSSFDYVNNLVL